jgi:hypothetical protein
MNQSMNTPYACKYKSDGSLLNPITKDEPYKTFFPNRRERRAELNTPRFINNRRGVHLTVVQTAKFFRHIQRQVTPDGRVVKILHYLEG